MKSLLALNPLIWKYRGRLLLGILFVVLTNVFAVWAPSMIGEGVNALEEANREYLVPLRQGRDVAALSRALDWPSTLFQLGQWLGLDMPAQWHPSDEDELWRASFGSV